VRGRQRGEGGRLVGQMTLRAIDGQTSLQVVPDHTPVPAHPPLDHSDARGLSAAGRQQARPREHRVDAGALAGQGGEGVVGGHDCSRAREEGRWARGWVSSGDGRRSV